jgi:hypothetical protein
MYVIVDLIIFGFVSTCRVFIGLFIMLMSLEGVRDIHRRLIGGEYSHRHPSRVQQTGGSVGRVYDFWDSPPGAKIKLFLAVGYDRIFGGSQGGSAVRCNKFSGRALWHNTSVRVSEDSSCLRPRGHCERLASERAKTVHALDRAATVSG